jgi:hypothetical protein
MHTVIVQARGQRSCRSFDHDDVRGMLNPPTGLHAQLGIDI